MSVSRLISLITLHSIPLGRSGRCKAKPIKNRFRDGRMEGRAACNSHTARFARHPTYGRTDARNCLSVPPNAGRSALVIESGARLVERAIGRIYGVNGSSRFVLGKTPVPSFRLTFQLHAYILRNSYTSDRPTP